MNQLLWKIDGGTKVGIGGGNKVKVDRIEIKVDKIGQIKSQIAKSKNYNFC